jgi:putative Mg2+ transporter-C (MgtC) family protein
VLAAGPDDQARSRVIQGIATGVGFLGAGEILVPSRPKRAMPEVHGLTSAASIWFTAALGITFATSTPLLAGVALVLALVTLSDRRNGNAKGNSNAVEEGSDSGLERRQNKNL